MRGMQWQGALGRMGCDSGTRVCAGVHRGFGVQSGVWTYTRGLARVDVLSSFVCNMMMDAWQEDQVCRMNVNVHVLLAPGRCHAHAASVARRQRAAHACATTLWKADTRWG